MYLSLSFLHNKISTSIFGFIVANIVSGLLCKDAISQTYLFHEPVIIHDSLRTSLMFDSIENIYPLTKRNCKILHSVNAQDSTNCMVDYNTVFVPGEAPCNIIKMSTFNCIDSLNRTVFEGFISKGKYQGNYIIHYPSGYVHVWMIIEKGNISGPVYHYYDIKSDKYVGKTWDKGRLMAELEYKNNLLWNVKGLYSIDGKALKKGNFKNGNGVLNLYRQNGSLLRTVEITNGVLHGVCRYYYSNGKTLMEGNYINGEQQGIWVEYSQEGNVLQWFDYGK